ncbi:uncharacterized protein [Rutidosis leptorrhynchoides]|uniref:uncharacterized protein n=1 Tax=Rutidosis leptorrhynchoides TaxID=125765 RepID=UPI003A992008
MTASEVQVENGELSTEAGTLQSDSVGLDGEQLVTGPILSPLHNSSGVNLAQDGGTLGLHKNGHVSPVSIEFGSFKKHSNDVGVSGSNARLGVVNNDVPSSSVSRQRDSKRIASSFFDEEREELKDLMVEGKIINSQKATKVKRKQRAKKVHGEELRKFNVDGL